MKTTITKIAMMMAELVAEGLNVCKLRYITHTNVTKVLSGT